LLRKLRTLLELGKLEEDGKLKFEVKWKEFEDSIWELAKSFERDGVKILEKFIEKIL
jgi:hypothetical protein